MGNTCFMNAALQAVSNTRPLTLYFQRDSQLSELNCTNPLGTKGVVAKRYAELCRELWAGSTRSVAPIKLRCCVTKHAPSLGGGEQHDSQVSFKYAQLWQVIILKIHNNISLGAFGVVVGFSARGP